MAAALKCPGPGDHTAGRTCQACRPQHPPGAREQQPAGAPQLRGHRGSRIGCRAREKRRRCGHAVQGSESGCRTLTAAAAQLVSTAPAGSATFHRLPSRLRASGARPAGAPSLDDSGRCCLQDVRRNRLLGEGEPGYASDGAALPPHALCSDPYRLIGAATNCIVACMLGLGQQKGAMPGIAGARSPARCWECAAR